MNRSISSIFVTSALLLMSACVSSGPATYVLMSVEGQVIDAHTKQPVEGAIVVVHWALKDHLDTGGARSLAIQESISNKDGYYRVSGVGPFKFSSRLGLTRTAPELLIFKSGYEYRQLFNKTDEVFETGMPFYLLRSDWNLKSIEIRNLSESTMAYKHSFEAFNGALERIVIRNVDLWCWWKRIPNTLRITSRERQRLATLGVDVTSIDMNLLTEDEGSAKNSGCGSPKQFFEGL